VNSTVSNNDQESLATLKLLVCLAKADGTLSAEERLVFTDSISQFQLPAMTTGQSLLDGTYNAASLAAEITSPAGREAAFAACFAMAHADHKIAPQEQAILQLVENAWKVPAEKKSLLGRVFAEAKDTVSLTAIVPIADPAKREAEITEDVRKYSILAGALGLFPIPVAKLATELAVVGVQGKMVRDIGQYWGRETTADGVKQLLAGMGVGQVARIALNTLMGFIPVVGSVVPAATNFASTWAVGRVANKFYASGGNLDPATLKEMFKLNQKKGKEAYAASKADVAAKAQENKGKLDALAADYKAGKITQADYQNRVLELK
jgi:uncharacterized protein (DUF697 family)/uncharacterized tellurite resistance protein B-like protein